MSGAEQSRRIPRTELPSASVLQALRRSHDKDLPFRERNRLKAQSTFLALQLSEQERTLLGITVVATGPLNKAKQLTRDYSVYTLFPNMDNKFNFIQVERPVLRGYTRSDVNRLVNECGDVREETLWESQKRTCIQIKDHDQSIRALYYDSSREAQTKRRRLHKERERLLLHYLQSSLKLEKEFPQLEYLFELDSEEKKLIMGQPRERNLPDRLLDASVAPILLPNDNDYSSPLDLNSLSYRAQQDPIAAQIYEILSD